MRFKLSIYKIIYAILGFFAELFSSKYLNGKKIMLGVLILGMTNTLSSCRKIIPVRTCYKTMPVDEIEIPDTINNNTNISEPDSTRVMCYDIAEPQ